VSCLKLFYKYWLPFIAYSLLIVYLSHQPHIELIYDPGDKTLHFLEYYAYAFFLRRLLEKSTPPRVRIRSNGGREIKKTQPQRAALIDPIFYKVLAISFLWGVTDEVHQYFIPGRFCEITDMLINVVGAYAWLLTYKYLPRKGLFKLVEV